jgi:hypothetical protein
MRDGIMDRLTDLCYASWSIFLIDYSTLSIYMFKLLFDSVNDIVIPCSMTVRRSFILYKK